MPLTKSGLRGDPISSLGPVPMGVFEGPEGAGLMGLIKKLVGQTPEDLKVIEQTPGWEKDYLGALGKDFSGMIEPGVNHLGDPFSGAFHLVYGNEKGEPVAAAMVKKLAGGKHTVPILVSDKGKGLLAQRAAMKIGQRLLDLGATPEGAISQDTSKLLQHLSKLVK